MNSVFWLSVKREPLFIEVFSKTIHYFLTFFEQAVLDVNIIVKEQCNVWKFVLSKNPIS